MQETSYPACPITLERVADDACRFTGCMAGPPATPYAGGKFALDVALPADYPFKPPTVRFATKIWHPNVDSETGAVVLSVLGTDWLPTLTLEKALLSLQSVLGSPKPHEAADAAAAEQFVTNEALFERTARFWTQWYAQGSDGDAEMGQMVQELVNLGFDVESALNTLSKTGWNVEEAVQCLFKD